MPELALFSCLPLAGHWFRVVDTVVVAHTSSTVAEEPVLLSKIRTDVVVGYDEFFALGNVSVCREYHDFAKIVPGILDIALGIAGMVEVGCDGKEGEAARDEETTRRQVSANEVQTIQRGSIRTCSS